MIHKKIGSMCLALLFAIIGLGLVGCDDPIAKIDRSASTATTIGSPESRGFVKINDNQYSFGGDMIFDVRDPNHKAIVFGETKSDGSRGMIHIANHKWPGGKVYYRFTTIDGFIPDPDEKKKVTDAMRIIENTIPGILFIEASQGSRPEICVISERPGMEYTGIALPGFSAFSFVDFRIFNGTYGLIIHELFHVLGLYHEHDRPERDDFVWFENYDPLKYPKYSSLVTDRFGTPFDFDSVMLYRTSGVHAQPAYQQWESHLRVAHTNISLNDIYTIQRLYGLIPDNTPAPPVLPTTTTTVWVQVPISLTYDNGSTSNGSFNPTTGTAMVVATSGSMSAIVNYPLNRSSYRIIGNIQVLGGGHGGSIEVGGIAIVIATNTLQPFSYPWTGNQQVKINSVNPNGQSVVKVTNLVLMSALGSSETLVPSINFPTGSTISGYYAPGPMPGSFNILNTVTQGSSTVTITLPQRSAYIVIGDLSLSMPPNQTNGIFSAGGQTIYATMTSQRIAFEWSGSNIATLAMSGIGSGGVRLQNVKFYGR